MSNHEQFSEPDHSQPDQPDQPYRHLDVITKLLAEAIALGDLDDPSTMSHITGDLSTLPPVLREFILKSLQEQADNDTPPEAPQ